MPTVTLTERRPAVVRVSRAAAVALRRAYPDAFDVVPAWKRGRVKVTPRGVVGTVTAGGVRWVVRPKLPAGALAALVGPGYVGGTLGGDPGDPALADLLADRLAALVAGHADITPGYAEERRDDASVRGRIDFARLARAARPGGPVPVVADEFTRDVPGNQAPAAAVRHLLAAAPLSLPARARLLAAAGKFAGVTPRVPAAGEWPGLLAHPRASRELLLWSRVVLAGTAADGPGFLIRLESVFQHLVTAGLAAALPAGWRADSPTLALDPPGLGPRVALRPDVVVTDAAGRPRAVWDAKWKTLSPAGPLAADVHQVLAYAKAFGVGVCGLVYPGVRSGRLRYALPGGSGVLHVVRVGLGGDAGADLRRVARRCLGRV